MENPAEPSALARLPVDGLTGPSGDGEEEPDASLAFGVAVVDDVGENEIAWVDDDARFLVCLADAPLHDGFPGFQVTAGRA